MAAVKVGDTKRETFSIENVGEEFSFNFLITTKESKDFLTVLESEKKQDTR